MKKLLLLGVAALAITLATPSLADQIVLADNPTSATGNFSFSPGGALFEDQVIFELTGIAPAWFTIANATNVFPAPENFISNWEASVWDAGLDGIVNNLDDNLLFGPQAASACIVTPNCQIVGGSAVLLPGLYYAEFTGQGGGTSGYSGNISTFAVPGPTIGGLGSIVKLVAGLIY
jgi:hypothetical protein